jgi:outer membrane protein assembly factor BamD (BamD/ComL family)
LFAANASGADPLQQTFEAAKEKFDSGQREFALMEFRNLVNFHPGSVYADEAQFRIAEYYYQRNARFDAEKELKKHLQMFPQSKFRKQVQSYLNGFQVENLLKTADGYYEQGNWMQAIPVYEQVLTLEARDDVKQKIEYSRERIAAEKEEARKLAEQLEAEYVEAQAEMKTGTEMENKAEKKPSDFKLPAIKIPDVKALQRFNDDFKDKIMTELQKYPQTRKLIPTRHDLLVWLKYFGIGVGLIWFVLFLYTANCINLIAKKLNLPNSDLAWLPFLNILLICDIGRRSRWFILPYLFIGIPFLGPLIVTVNEVYLWSGVSSRRGNSPWLGLLAAFPLANLVLFGYLAFKDNGDSSEPDRNVPEEDNTVEQTMVAKPKSGRF